MQTKATSNNISTNLSFKSFTTVLDLQFINAFWKYNPLAHYTPEVIRQVLTYERSIFPTAQHIVQRQIISASEHFPKLKLFNLNFPDYLDQKLLNSPQHVRFVEAPITFMIDIMGQVLASSFESRMNTFKYLQGIETIPSQFLLHFKRIRKSKCGNIYITPKLDIDANIAFINSNPQFHRTFLDFQWLQTDEGLQYVNQFLIQVTNCNAYIKTEPFTLASLPSFEAHLTTKLSALFTEQIDNFTTMKTQFLCGHSINLENADLPLLILQAVMCSPTLVDENDKPIVQQGNPAVLTRLDQYLLSTYCVEVSKVSSSSDPTEKKNLKRSRNKKSVSYETQKTVYPVKETINAEPDLKVPT